MIHEADPKRVETGIHTFSVSLHQGNYEFWADYSGDIKHILTASFRDDFKAFSIWEMHNQAQSDCTSDASRIYVLQNEDKNPVGFSYWYPLRYSPPAIFSPFKQIYCFKHTNLNDMKQHAMQVGFTAILPEYRHHGGWTLLMNNIDNDAIKQGYRFMFRYVRQANEYSQKIERRYHDQIMAEAPYNGWGKQVKYWILLGDSPELT